MPGPSPYEVLGVSPQASVSEIRAAFREKLRASHPDTTPGSGDGEVIEVVEAYRRLMGPGSPGRTGAQEQGESNARRVEVRRGGPAASDRGEARKQPVCPECRGEGMVATRVVCPGCGGTGAITRLEAHGAQVVGCRRCGGRGEGRAYGSCPTCGGSGQAPEPDRER